MNTTSMALCMLGGTLVLVDSACAQITNIHNFLETCPMSDPAVVPILNDFKIRANGVLVENYSCHEPISALALSDYTDPLIVLQGLRVIYYMDRGMSGHLPWTSGTLYDWMKSQIRGIDVRTDVSNSFCCENLPDGRYIVVQAQNDFNRDFDRTWLGIAGNIGLYAHEVRHVSGIGHSSCCGIPGGCDDLFATNNLSAYGVQWWLEKAWLYGEINVGFACADPVRVLDTANWHLGACNSFRDRFCTNKPPVLSLPSAPGGACPRPARLLAHYTLDGTAADRTGNSAPMELWNTTFTNGTLCLNGLYELGDPQGFHALATISGFSYESFTVALDFFAADFSDFSNDNILTGGPSYRWFSLRHNAGRLEVTLNNQSLVYLLPDGALRTNEWQNVLCSVDASAKRIITVLDGRRLQDVVLRPDFSFEVIGSPVENSDRVFMFANYSNASVFHGYVDNLKVWSRALNSPEIEAMLSVPSLSIEKAVVVSWPSFPPGFVLQSSTDINGPYENYSGTIFTEGAESKAVVPLDSSQRFFHLVKP